MIGPKNATSGIPHLSRTDLWLAVGLALAVCLLYAQTAAFDFVSFDDEAYVYGNRMVRLGLSIRGLGWAVTTFHAANWHPVTWISHMLDVEMFGLDPGPHHLHNVCLHMLNTVLLFLLFRTTTGNRGAAALVAAVFAIHPLQVETVAWVSQRKALLSTFFGLLSTIAYLRYARSRHRLPYTAAILSYALALMSKPTVVVLPLIWLLLDRWPMERIPGVESRQRGLRMSVPVIEKLPFFGMAVFTGGLTLLAQHQGGAVAGLEALPPGLRMANAAVAGAAYLLKAVWPAGLAIFYPFPAEIPPIRWAPAAALILGLCAASIAAWRNRPWVFVGWWWYLVSLVPVIGIVQVGAQSMADRYTYLPLIGCWAAIVWEARSRLPGSVWAVRAAVLFTVATGIVLAAVSWRQIGYWTDSIHLFERAVAVTENNARAHAALGSAFLQKGETARAEVHLRTALAIDPTAAKAHNNLGTLLLQQGQLSAAAEHFTEAVRLRPRMARAYCNLALVRRRQGRTGQALHLLEQALRIDGDLAQAHFQLGTLWAERGDWARAADQFERAVQLDPGDRGSRNNLGTAWMILGRLEDAVAVLQKGVQLHPDDAELRNNLGVALARAGRPDEAAALFKKAVQLQPDFAEAKKNLERLKLKMQE
ncbi:MAG: tetratricopeptide repeat protein [Desulfobacteraceae bacterium]|nr:tetratricopeptide repeat protein [Desulfobacteraceae bacterium]